MLKITMAGGAGAWKVYYQDCMTRFGMKYDEIVTELVKPLYESMDEEAVEEVRELIYSASYSAEKYGFYLGIHTAVKFITEAMNILDETHEQ